MIHSSRQTRPTSTLRRTASATPSFNTDATEFSKQFAFHHLLNSPLPSPALPSIVPRHGKKPTPRSFRRAFRISARFSTWLCALAILYWLFSIIRSTADSPSSVTYLTLNMNEYDFAGRDAPTQDPAPVVVADTHKKPKWTVSIPQDASFPLKPSQYAGICAQSDHIVKQLSTKHTHFHTGSPDSQAAINFVDVQEAHDQGLLTQPRKKETQARKEALNQQSIEHLQEHVDIQSYGARQDSGICEKSLTFLMESTDAGMGKTLLGLWMAYGLAQEEGRSFFIDDSNWAYGTYTTFFKPQPVPSCKLPPATQRLPCPHQTRHLVVSSSTYQWAFGDLVGSLSHHHSPKHTTRQRRAFFLARTGYDALFHLTGADADYLSNRLLELDSTTYSHGGLTIGLHVRRGDRRPWEPQYSDSYIPPSTYLTVAQSLLNTHFNLHNTTLTHETASGLAASIFLLASDDPEIYSTPEFIAPSIQRAQSQILLASKATLDAALPDPAPAPTADDPAFIKFVEPNVGWEGGFFASIFWGLGNPSEGRRAARGERDERPKIKPNEETIRLREYMGRAYLLDLKVLGSASGGVVCGVSSFGCRILGVMRGWEDVEAGKGWRNVDGGYKGWVGLVEGE
ncbi:MAG: hypothetical protein LQ343_007167 [Gyalolechia ehrenbergii]|nr:MAG: hypothetical protein LQ343_007167 [Gyalolechia ehrenbergii]